MIHKNGKEEMPKLEGSWKEEGISEGFTGKVLFELSRKGFVCFENSSPLKLAGRRKKSKMATNWPALQLSYRENKPWLLTYDRQERSKASLTFL